MVAKEWVVIEEVRDCVNHRAVTSEGGGGVKDDFRQFWLGHLEGWWCPSLDGFIFGQVMLSCLPQGTEHSCVH